MDGFCHTAGLLDDETPMSDRQSQSPTSTEEFNRLLTSLLQRATANGLDVRGAYRLDNPYSDQYDWDVEIHQVVQ